MIKLITKEARARETFLGLTGAAFAKWKARYFVGASYQSDVMRLHEIAESRLSNPPNLDEMLLLGWQYGYQAGYIDMPYCDSCRVLDQRPVVEIGDDRDDEARDLDSNTVYVCLDCLRAGTRLIVGFQEGKTDEQI